MQQSNLVAVAESPSVCLDLAALALGHPCARHPLFATLRQTALSKHRAGALLRNYDAHACVLRRLLLKAAAIMPEEAVGFILENVRTEFGAGDINARHQLQLTDLAFQAGVTASEFKTYPVQAGIKKFIKAATGFYFPAKLAADRQSAFNRYYRPAIAAGAITATEVLALEEFKAMQVAFSTMGLEHHIWFDHVTVEANHSAESVALAHHFMAVDKNVPAVLFGLNGVLDANMALYDGLLAALQG